ncbi:hypothetical protein Q9S36_10185 [Microbacterium sp. ARD31]|uniref:hypothetical protein n=1 Tax=unclassified Microbacterium TaxID=2609290 RepID=UPI0020413E1A|nr:MULTISPECIES: hypothetical protein [unclassified Microbacterium]MDT0180571.1 hypothetical protein [Microbacterium sp. ARD31]
MPDGEDGREPERVGADDVERPLDPDLDDDRLDSAAADEQAAAEGTMDGDVENV